MQFYFNLCNKNLYNDILLNKERLSNIICKANHLNIDVIRKTITRIYLL